MQCFGTAGPAVPEAKLMSITFRRQAELSEA